MFASKAAGPTPATPRRERESDMKPLSRKDPEHTIKSHGAIKASKGKAKIVGGTKSGKSTKYVGVVK